MVRTYVRRTNRQSWSPDDLARAIADVRQNKTSLRAAAQQFNVPFITIRRHMLATVPPRTMGRFKPVFDTKFEEELVQYVIEMQQRFYGLSPKQLRRMAFDLAEKNKLKHNFNRIKCSAGKDWSQGFLRRHPQLSLRSPEPTSIMRATGFNRVQVQKFYGLLRTELEQNAFQPHRIFNMDETGISSVQKPGKILASKGAKQVGKLTSAERGQNVTLVCSMNAAGSYIPPAFIFPRKNMSETLMNGAPPGSVGYAVGSGWMDCATFVKWLRHFQMHTSASNDNKVLLILDNHASHRSLEVVDFARDNGIVILSLPPHTSHKMQPLDKTFFGPLKKAYYQACDSWLVSHPGKRISMYNIASLLGVAYGQCATISKGVSGFSSTGIFPFNADIFTDVDYAPAATTDRPNTTVPNSTNGDLMAATSEMVAPTLCATVAKTIPRPATTAAPATGKTIFLNRYRIPPTAASTTVITEQPSSAASTAVITEQPPTAASTAVITEQLPTAASTAVITEQLPTATSTAVITGQPPTAASTAVITEQPPTAASTAVITEQPPTAASTAVITEQPHDTPIRVSVFEFSPLPKSSRENEQGRKRNAQQAELLTGSPFKKLLEHKRDDDNRKQTEKERRAQKRMEKQKAGTGACANLEKGSKGNSKVVKAKGKGGRKECGKKGERKSSKVASRGAVETDEKIVCIFCGEDYSDPPTEEWIMCYNCNRWCHEDCADLDAKDSNGNFICGICND